MTKSKKKDTTVQDLGNETKVKKIQTSGVFMTNINIINVIIGSGIIALPVSFSFSGVGMSVILLMISGLLTHFSIIAISMLIEITGKNTYQEFVQETLGMPGLICISVCQILYPYFAVLSYGIVICDNFTSIFQYLAPGVAILQNRPFILFLAMFIIIFPLTCFKNVSFLDKMSLVSVICIIFYFLVIVVMNGFQPQKVFCFHKIFEFARPGVAQGISVLAFAMGCQQLIAPIYRSMTDKTITRLSYSTYGAIGFSILIYNIMAISGYVMFAGLVQGNLLQSFCPDNNVITATRIVFALSLILSSPLQLIACREGFTTLLFKRIKFKWWIHILITFLLCVIAYAVSSNVNDLGIVISFAGALVGSPISFIIPPVALLFGIKKGFMPNTLLKVICYVVMIFGCSVMIIGAIMTFVGEQPKSGNKYWCAFDTTPIEYDSAKIDSFKKGVESIWIKVNNF